MFSRSQTQTPKGQEHQERKDWERKFRLSQLSQSQRDRERKSRINKSCFYAGDIGEGGPLFTYVGNSSHNSNAFREGHERTFGKQDMFKNLAKE